MLSPDYGADVENLPTDELRSRRAECGELEGALSYMRRLIQGRLDIAGAELRRRTEGGEPSDVHALVARLPEILSEKVRAPGLGRLTDVAPPEADDLVPELDAVADARTVARVTELDDDEVRRLVDELQELEQTVSGRRRQLHERIDVFQAELVRRYRTGEESVESLLR